MASAAAADVNVQEGSARGGRGGGRGGRGGRGGGRGGSRDGAGQAREGSAAEGDRPRPLTVIPFEKAHNEKVEAINSKIAALEAERNGIRPPRVEGEEKPAKSADQLKREALLDELKAIRPKKDELIAQRKAIMASVDKLKEAFEKKKEEQQKAKSQGKFRTPEEIDAAIKDLEEQMRSSKLGLQEEKRLVNDIDNLKRSKKGLSSADSAKKELDDIRANMNTNRDKATLIQNQINEHKAREDALRTELDAMKNPAAVQERLDRTERLKKIKEDLDALYNERRELQTKFREEKEAFLTKVREEREKARLKQQEERKQREEAYKAQQEAKQRELEEYEASRPAWEEEINTCDLLIGYLKPFIASETEAEKPAAAKVDTAKLDASAFGEGQFLRRKDDDEEFGGKKKKLQGGPKKAKAAAVKKFKHDPAIFEQFSKIGMTPPPSTAEVPQTLQALEEKKAHYKVTPRPAKATARVRAEKAAKEEKKEEAVADELGEAMQEDKKAEEKKEEEAEKEEEEEEEKKEEEKKPEEEKPKAEEKPKEEEKKAEAPAAAAPAAAATPVPARLAAKEKPFVLNEDIKPPTRFLIYDDDPAIGQTSPSLATLKFIKGDPVEVGKGKITVVFFWASFADGDFPVVCSVSQMAKRYPGVDVVGISFDGMEENITKFIGKIGCTFPEIKVSKLEADFALAFDPDRTVRNAFSKIAKVQTLTASCIFLIDAAGKIVWREQFSQAHSFNSGQFEVQVKRLFNNEPLVKNGNRPKAEGEEEEESMDLGDDFDF